MLRQRTIDDLLHGVDALFQHFHTLIERRASRSLGRGLFAPCKRKCKPNFENHDQADYRDEPFHGSTLTFSHTSTEPVSRDERLSTVAVNNTRTLVPAAVLDPLAVLGAKLVADTAAVRS